MLVFRCWCSDVLRLSLIYWSVSKSHEHLFLFEPFCRSSRHQFQFSGNSWRYDISKKHINSLLLYRPTSKKATEVTHMGWRFHAPRASYTSMFFDVWEMKIIIHECRIDKNMCADLLKIIKPWLVVQNVVPDSSRPRARFLQVANQCFVVVAFTIIWGRWAIPQKGRSRFCGVPNLAVLLAACREGWQFSLVHNKS